MRVNQGIGALIGGLVLVAIGVWVLLARYVPSFEAGQVWPIVAVGAGALLTVLGVRRAGSPVRWMRGS
jgi:hypothetical protein